MEQHARSLKISVIIPVYNVSMYVERCLESVMSQTHDNFECILVDDASPDDSIAKCEKLIANYHGAISFVILHHEQNKGLSAARNTGTNAAAGDYVFYLDSDNEITPDCIEKMVQPIRKDPTIEMVLGNHAICLQSDPSQTPIKQNQTHFHVGDFDSLEKVRDLFYNTKGGYGGNAWNKLINKDFLIQNQLYFKEGVNWEDLLWSFFMVKYLKHLYIIPDITLYYYIRPQSIITGSNRKEKARHLEKVFEEIANHFSEKEKGLEAKEFLRPFCSVLIDNYNSQITQQTARLFLNALSCGPYRSERLYLRLTVFLSKFALGRSIFAIARDMRKAVNK